jgi:hypothetical protein
MRKSLLLILTILLSFSISKAQTAHVSAYQAGAYQPGLLNLRDLATLDSPGLIFIDYNYWNNSNAFYDQNGDKVSNIDINRPVLNINLDLTQQVSGYVNVPVIFYASDLKILGGRYMASINPVFLGSNFRMNIHVDETDSTVTSTGNVGGLGDIAIMPFGLGWSFKDKIDLSFFYTFYAPTGRYETGATDNIGRGYWTHQFQLPTYFYFIEKATAILVMPTFEMNGVVKDSDVRAGNRFTIEYGVSQYLTSWLEIEVLNGHNWQVGDDKGEDVWWRNTLLDARDQTSTISFGVNVWPWEGRLQARAKYALDYGTKQRYKSNFWAFSVIFIPNLLTGSNKG